MSNYTYKQRVLLCTLLNYSSRVHVYFHWFIMVAEIISNFLSILWSITVQVFPMIDLDGLMLSVYYVYNVFFLSTDVNKKL